MNNNHFIIFALFLFVMPLNSMDQNHEQQPLIKTTTDLTPNGINTNTPKIIDMNYQKSEDFHNSESCILKRLICGGISLCTAVTCASIKPWVMYDDYCASGPNDNINCNETYSCKEVWYPTKCDSLHCTSCAASRDHLSDCYIPEALCWVNNGVIAASILCACYSWMPCCHDKDGCTCCRKEKK